MLARRWVVRIFDPEYMGTVYFDTRAEGRRLVHALKALGYSAYVTRTGL